MGKSLPRRERGTGSITESEYGFKASIRLPDASGVKKPKYKRFDSYQEAEDWLASVQARHRGERPDAIKTLEKKTVADLLRLWLRSKYRENKLSARPHLGEYGKPDMKTITEYDSICRDKIIPVLGDMELRKVNNGDIEHWQDTIYSYVSPKTGKQLSPQQKNKIWQVVRQAFKYGVEQGFISSDPTSSVKGFPQTSVDPKEKAFSDRDFKLFQDVVSKHGCDHPNGYCRLRWEIAMYTGRRQGECLGLGWGSVDLKKKVMRVEAKLVAPGWKHGCKKDPETGKPGCGTEARYCPRKWGGGLELRKGTKGGLSVKPNIPISGLLEAFIEHKKVQDVEREKAKREGTYDLLSDSHSALVFTQPTTQRPFWASHDTDLFKNIVKEAGIPEGKYSVHSLRHTTGTRLAVSTGGDLPIIAAVLGHKSIHTSMLYISPDEKAKQTALDKMMTDAGAVLGETDKPKPSKKKKNKKKPEAE